MLKTAASAGGGGGTVTSITAGTGLTGGTITTTGTIAADTTVLATNSFVNANFAPLASPSLTGTPTAPTAAPGTSTTQLATTAFVATSYAPLSNPSLLGFRVTYSLDVSKYTSFRSDSVSNLILSNNAGADTLVLTPGGTLVLNYGPFQVYNSAGGNVARVASGASGSPVVFGVDSGSVDTNVGAVIGNPKGTGAITAQVPDSTTAGGNARGANAVDLQTSRTNANQVASGASSFAGGSSNQASGANSTVFGSGNSATNTGATAIGQSHLVSGGSAVALGNGHVADGGYSFAVGGYASTHGIYGAHVFASGRISTNTGGVQGGNYVLRGQATAGGAVRVSSDGNAPSTSNVLNLPTNTTWNGTLLVVARSATDSSWATWAYPNFLINRNAAAPFLSAGTAVFQNGGGTVTLTTALSVSADAGAPNGINISFTPPNTNTWDVVAVYRSAEVQ